MDTCAYRALRLADRNQMLWPHMPENFNENFKLQLLSELGEINSC